MPGQHAAEPALSAIGLGCSRIGSFNNPMALSGSRRLVEAALDLGVTVLDTANIYGQGDSERVIGQAIDGRRDAAFVVTKTGLGFSARMRLLLPLKPMLRPLLARGGTGPAVTAKRGAEMRRNFAPEGFAASLDASLHRLRTDHVDGFLLHSPAAADLEAPGIDAALASLKASGRLRHYGVSCDDRAGLEAALNKLPGMTLLQLPWDLIEPADAATHAIAARGIVVLAREVIRLQPSLAPVAAVARSVRTPGVACTLVGTGSAAHLQQLVEGTR